MFGLRQPERRAVEPGKTMSKTKARGMTRNTERNPAKPRLTGRRRRPEQGATRNVQVAPRDSRVNVSLWFNRVLILCSAAVVLVAGLKGALIVQSLPVQRISVSGELEHTQAQAVQDMVEPALAGGFLKADLQQIRRQLESLPWIYEAGVRRRWPASLEIHVVEETPIARWGDSGFLNHQGGIFHSARGGEWDVLPLLTGPQGSAPALMTKYQRLLGFLAPLNLSVTQLSVDARGQMEAVLASGMQLNLGGEDFLARMRRFVTLYERELAPRQGEVERVDLRYASGVAVAFKASPPVAGL